MLVSTCNRVCDHKNSAWNWKTLTVSSPADIKEWLKHDWTAAVVNGGHRRTDCFISSQLLIGDIDNTTENKCTREQFHEMFKEYNFFTCTSRNHQKEKKSRDGEKTYPAEDRFHFGFILKESVDDHAKMKEYMTRFIFDHNFCDPAVKDAVRYFAGFPETDTFVNITGKSYEPLDLTKDIQEKIEAEKIANTKQSEKPIEIPKNLDDPLDVFSYMDGIGRVSGDIMKDASSRKKLFEAIQDTQASGFFDDYDEWLRLGFALKVSGFSIDDYKSLSWPNAQSACDRVWNSVSVPTGITSGTLVHFARLSRPSLFKKKLQSVEYADKIKHAERINTAKKETAKKLEGHKDIMRVPCPFDIWFPGHVTESKNGEDITPKPSIENTKILLNHYGISVWENMMNHNTVIELPGTERKEGNEENASLTRIKSIMTISNFPSYEAQALIDAVAHENQRHPFKEFIESFSWDGVDRMTEAFQAMGVLRDQDYELCKVFWNKWLLSQIAVLYEKEPRTRGVLTLQGAQSKGKTSFLKSLYPEGFFKDGLSFDTASKDDRITALAYACCELGELEGTFKKSDIAALKSFLTTTEDRYRRPYEAKAETHKRRTVFCASVNDSKFLSDQTGSTRFWIIKVGSLNYKHSIDIGQLWAQMKHSYDMLKECEMDYIWWLTPEEEERLDVKNQEHNDVSMYEEKILKYYDYTKKATRILTCTDIAIEIGLQNPKQQDVRAISVYMRNSGKFFSGTTKSKNKGWRMPEMRTMDELSDMIRIDNEKQSYHTRDSNMYNDHPY